MCLFDRYGCGEDQQDYLFVGLQFGFEGRVLSRWGGVEYCLCVDAVWKHEKFGQRMASGLRYDIFVVLQKGEFVSAITH